MNRNSRNNKKINQLKQQDTGKSMMFEFGDPEPVLSNRIMDYFGTFLDATGEYYTPPFSLDGLASLLSANPYHGPIIHFKKYQLIRWFIPHAKLSRKAFEKLVYNYLALGNGYLQRHRNGFNNSTRFVPLPSIPMRRGKETNKFFMLKNDGSKVEFAADEVLHMKMPDLKQEIYGVPEYVGGIQSILLSEDSTLFRRKYYVNGAHMGYILVTTDARLNDDTAKMVEEQVKQSKGPGNFRSLYLNIPKTNAREPVKVIPVGDIGSKDEYERIKGITEREMLAMHRVYAGLAGIIPDNVGGFGDMRKLMEVYYEMEVTAMQADLAEINELAGEEIVRFSQPDWKQAEETSAQTRG